MYYYSGRGRRRTPAAAFRGSGPVPFIQRNIIAPWLRRGLRRAAIAELEAMPDYLLDDIGIEREQIPRVADAIVSGPGRAAPPSRPLASAAAPELRRAA